MRGRTERIQAELDGAAAELATAEREAATIRQAVGDIGAERARLLAEADVHAEALLTDGRARLEAEIVDLHAKADADIAALANRGGDELRSEIGHVAAAAADRIVRADDRRRDATAPRRGLHLARRRRGHHVRSDDRTVIA